MRSALMGAIKLRLAVSIKFLHLHRTFSGCIDHFVVVFLTIIH